MCLLGEDLNQVQSLVLTMDYWLGLKWPVRVVNIVFSYERILSINVFYFTKLDLLLVGFLAYFRVQRMTGS